MGESRRGRGIRGLTRWWVVSDVDGTLLDADGRFTSAPRKMRDALRAVLPHAEIVLASSRTLDELRIVQHELGVSGHVIAEDGAVVAEERSGVPIVSPLGLVAHSLKEEWERIADKLPARVRHAGQLSADELAERGINSAEARARAIDNRFASVLLDLADMSSETWDALLAHVRAANLEIARGGRWATITDRASKGRALRWLRDRNLSADLHVIAIGNDENDRSLLESADIAFVIRNPETGAHPSLSAIPGAVVLASEGPHGWLEMIDRLPGILTHS